jgi:hypothetical protein
LNAGGALDSKTTLASSVKKPAKRAKPRPNKLAKAIPRNEQKAMVKALEEKEVLFTNFNNILAAVLKDPTLWTKHEFQPLRDFTTTVISNPCMFAHALPDSLEKKKLDCPSKHPPPTKGLARSLYARETISNSELIVVVTAISQKFRQFNIANTTMCTSIKQFTMAVIDGDEELLTLKVDTSLNQSMGLVEKGSVLRLTVFVPIYFRYSDPTDLNVVILLSNFRKIAQIEVDPKFAFPPKEGRLQMKAMPPPPPDPPPSPLKEQLAPSDVRCNGDQCSLYGVKFACCVTQCFPVNSKIVVEIARENPFCTMGVEEMENSHKRFILYYWYVTNVYSVTGSKNRAKLPKCLVSAIRQRFPNPIDTPYIEFQE